jgi:hypothetical protein
MPPLPPGVSKVGLVKGYGGWNNSSFSRRSNTIRGLLSTRTPQSTGNSGGGIPNPSLGIGVINEAMPKGATGSWVPRSISLRRPNFQLQKTFKGENNTDSFGYSVAISGDYAIVGAFSFESGAGRGKVYIYERGAAGWTQVMTYEGENNLDAFGFSVAISGDYAIVGAKTFEDGGGTIRGKVYIYERGAGGWPVTATATYEGENNDDEFGHSVAISADYAIVGAKNFEGGSTARGKVYIYERGALGGWPVTATATYEGENNFNQFGHSVAISGGYAIVGAIGFNGGAYQGKVYIYERDALGGWPVTATQTFEGKNNNDFFGVSVAISSDYAIVGAVGFNGAAPTGKVYIYERGAGGWPTTATETFEGENNDDKFGHSVAISANYAIVGAVGFNGGAGTGKVYIYERIAGVWTEVTTFEGENNNDFFGHSVAISADNAIVGASRFQSNAFQGKVYIYKR